jgi:hypothetical protein
MNHSRRQAAPCGSQSLLLLSSYAARGAPHHGVAAIVLALLQQRRVTLHGAHVLLLLGAVGLAGTSGEAGGWERRRAASTKLRQHRHARAAVSISPLLSPLLGPFLTRGSGRRPRGRA